MQSLYADPSLSRQSTTLSRLGPLRQSFTAFIEREACTTPIAATRLVQLFDSCIDAGRSDVEHLDVLHQLMPGNGQVGFRQVNFLVDVLRAKVQHHLGPRVRQLPLVAHDHAFGSGGDFEKTIHATTDACIIVAPLLTICKTGTTNVTSRHGSSQAITKIGYGNTWFDPSLVNYLLETYNFAYVSLASLGFPYSPSLTAARKRLWNQAVQIIDSKAGASGTGRQAALRDTNIPIDIFKVVSPNAQALNPAHHSTGVSHLGIVPYILSIYFHLNTTGLIVHCYDGIDEISNASRTTDPSFCNNLIIKVESEAVTIAEFSPEDIGLARTTIESIQEQDEDEDEARVFWSVVSGTEKGARRDFIVANAAALLVASGKLSSHGSLTDQLRAGVDQVNNLIDAGISYENAARLKSFLAAKNARN